MNTLRPGWNSMRVVPVLAALLLMPQYAANQSVATFRAESRLVEVATTVLDHRGHFVDGLDSKDFQILDNGQPQTIKYFANNNEALSCAIVLDTTGSMEKALPRLK